MKSMSKLMFALCVGLSSITLAAANDAPRGGQSAVTSLSAGEVKKVDKDAKKITIKHGELKNLNMAPMTMVFQVQDSSYLDKVKAGDKIEFLAEKVGGKLMVTHMERIKQ